MSFHVATESTEDELVLRFQGDLDEEADFSTISIPPETNQIRLDLRDVKMLNSLGIRAWVHWIRQIPSNIVITFSRCPHFVVEQMNILEGFLPIRARVESFYVPYLCETCKYEQMILATRGTDFVEGTTDNPEGEFFKTTLTCPGCNDNMELDVLPDKYFHFLKYRK